MKHLVVASILSFMFGGAMIILFAHAVNQQQVVMQEGY